MFLNEQTAEYQFYEVTFRAVRPGVITTIDLVTPVRQSVPHTLMLENPLSYAVTFAASCNVSEVLMPNQLSVPANSEVNGHQSFVGLRVMLNTPDLVQLKCGSTTIRRGTIDRRQFSSRTIGHGTIHRNDY